MLERYEELNWWKWWNTRKAEIEKEILNISVLISKKNNLIRNTIREKLEKWTNEKIYDEILFEVNKEMNILESRKQDLSKSIKDLESQKETWEIVLKLSEKYKYEYWKIDDIDKDLLISKLVDRIEIFIDRVVVRYRFEKEWVIKLNLNKLDL